MPVNKPAKRKSPFSVFQGAKDAGRLGSRSERAINKALGKSKDKKKKEKK